MNEIKVYRVPQLMAKRINVICVNGVPFCTVRGKKATSDIIAKLSGYDVTICDGRIDKLAEQLKEEWMPLPPKYEPKDAPYQKGE